MTTVGALLAHGRELGVDRLDAQQLVAHALYRSRSWVLAHDDHEVAPAQASAAVLLLQRRAGGEPFAYLVGEREFHGLPLRVTPHVLIPRPDTEVLVDWALELLAGPLADVGTPEVLDLGTGSGAIALAVKHACARARVSALDTSAPALELARANAARLGLEVSFLPSDWWRAVRGCRYDLALSNPPYIRADDPHLAGLSHEPLAALTPGTDGLRAIHELADGALEHLKPDGWLLIEHGHDQGHEVRQRLLEAGLEHVSTRLDIEGRDRCTGGRAPGEAWTQRS